MAEEEQDMRLKAIALQRRVGRLQHHLRAASRTLAHVQKGVIEPNGGAVAKALADLDEALLDEENEGSGS